MNTAPQKRTWLEARRKQKAAADNTDNRQRRAEMEALDERAE